MGQRSISANISDMWATTWENMPEVRRVPDGYAVHTLELLMQ